ncbi:MAG: ATPase, T2SS/T4P/T4SS family [Subdoligranulum sp.]
MCGPAGFADITSLNLRVARQVPCVLPPQLRRTLDALNGGILVVGTPGSGKTTFLRSIIRYLDTARRIFCVADERGELLTAGHTVHCDVSHLPHQSAGHPDGAALHEPSGHRV